MVIPETSSGLMKTSFSSNESNVTNIAEDYFAGNNEPPKANQNFSGVFKHFSRKLTKNSNFGTKSDYLRKNQRINRKDFLQTS